MRLPGRVSAALRPLSPLTRDQPFSKSGHSPSPAPRVGRENPAVANCGCRFLDVPDKKPASHITGRRPRQLCRKLATAGFSRPTLLSVSFRRLCAPYRHSRGRVACPKAVIRHCAHLSHSGAMRLLPERRHSATRLKPGPFAPAMIATWGHSRHRSSNYGRLRGREGPRFHLGYATDGRVIIKADWYQQSE